MICAVKTVTKVPVLASGFATSLHHSVSAVIYCHRRLLLDHEFITLKCLCM